MFKDVSFHSDGFFHSKNCIDFKETVKMFKMYLFILKTAYVYKELSFLSLYIYICLFIYISKSIRIIQFVG